MAAWEAVTPLRRARLVREARAVSLGSRVVMMLFGGAIFGGSTAAAVGNLLRLTAGDTSDGVVAGVAGGLGLALLLIGSSGRES